MPQSVRIVLPVLAAAFAVLSGPVQRRPRHVTPIDLGTTCRASALLVTLRAPAAQNQADYQRFGGPGGGPRPPIAPNTNSPLPDRKLTVSMIFPVLGDVRRRDDYNESRGTFRHTAIDIDAPKMRPIVAPFAGILGFKTQTFWIIGDSGYKCLGTHLNDDTPGTNDNRADPDYMFAPNIRPGDHVAAGQFIGYVGDSGQATGPHLHFELFAPDGGLVSPLSSLNAATHISAPRPVLYGHGIKPGRGEFLIQGCFRGWDPAHRTLTVLLVSRQSADGGPSAVTTPTRYRLTLPPDMAEKAGGDRILSTLLRDRPLTFTVAAVGAGRSRAVGAGTAGTALLLVLPAGGAPGTVSITAIRHSSAPASGGRGQRSPNSGRITRTQPPDIVFADFEPGTYDRWTLTGDCWDSAPATGAALGGSVHGYQGRYFLCSCPPNRGGAATGKATSVEFTIKRTHINFLIGGGRIPEQIGMNLVVEDQVVRSETGSNSSTLQQVSWDVTNLIGKQARIVIVDRSTAPDFGFILVDQVRFENHAPIRQH